MPTTGVAAAPRCWRSASARRAGTKPGSMGSAVERSLLAARAMPPRKACGWAASVMAAPLEPREARERQERERQQAGGDEEDPRAAAPCRGVGLRHGLARPPQKSQ